VERGLLLGALGVLGRLLHPQDPHELLLLLLCRLLYGFGVWVLGFGFWGSGCGVSGVGFRDKGLGFGV
jgi:hypothetical protein